MAASKKVCRLATDTSYSMCCPSDDELCKSSSSNFDYCSDNEFMESKLRFISCPVNDQICGSQEEFTLLPWEGMWKKEYLGVSNITSVGSAVTSFAQDQCMFHVQGDTELNEAF